MGSHPWLNSIANQWVVDIGNSGIKVTLARAMHSSMPAVLQSGPNTGSQGNQLDWSRTQVQRVWQATWKHADLHNTTHHKTKVALHDTNECILDVDDPAWPMRMLREVHDTFGVELNSTASGWLVSSVQRIAWQNWMTQLAQHRPQDQTQKFENRDLRWPLKVDFPERVGTDRVLAAWATWNLLGRTAPAVVIQAGTAITVDAINEHGEYAGGAILPGLRLTLNALAGGTDLLPHLTAADSPAELPPLPGKNTEAAMLAGGVAAVIGGIDHLLHRYQAFWSHSAPVIISGGNRAYLSPLLSYPTRVVDHLVLLGLCGLLDTNGE